MSHALELQIRSLEAQLSALRAELANEKVEGKKKTAADLYGIFKGKMDLTEEEIRAVRYRFTWDGEEIQ